MLFKLSHPQLAFVIFGILYLLKCRKNLLRVSKVWMEKQFVSANHNLYLRRVGYPQYGSNIEYLYLHPTFKNHFYC